MSILPTITTKRFLVLSLASFLIGLILLSGLQNVRAQEEDQATPTETPIFNFDKALTDYEYSYNQYRQAHLQYETAKKAYLKFGTLNSKNEAQEKTALMLRLRDETIRTYLTALRLKLADVTEIDDYNLNLFYLKLDDEVLWYQGHINDFRSAGTLEDLLTLAKASEEKYNSQSLSVAYQVLHGIINYKVAQNTDQVEAQTKVIKTKLNQIKQAGDKDVTLAERWLLEAENRLAWSQEKQVQSQVEIDEIDQQRYGYSNKRDKRKTSFYQARFLLEEAQQYLKETNSYLLEVIREIKNAD